MASDGRNFLKGAFLLTVAGVIGKVLSAGYRIPLQNLTGDIGFYIYQQVYPLLGMALVVSLYGFPAAISKMTVDMKEQGKSLTGKHFYFPVFIILFFVMGILSLSLFVFSEPIAHWIGDEGLARAYRLVSVSFLLIPFTSLLRGVFQGQQNMQPTAYSQMGEQLIRVFVIIGVAVYVGIQGDNHYRIGEGAAIASIAGASIAILILLLFFKKQQRVPTISRQTIPWDYYVRTLLTLGLVASLNHMVLLLFQFADTFTMIPALQEYGLLKKEAMEAKGVLDRGQPLIQLGMVLGSSFALAMIPSISKNKLHHDSGRFYRSVQSGVKVSFYLAAGATAGLIAIMPEANILLYEDMQGTDDLRILVASILLSSVAVACATILQGLGYWKRTAVFILISVCIKWTGNEWFVPLIGIRGSAWATVSGLAVLFLLVLVELRRKLPHLQLARHIHWRALFFAVFGMIAYILVIDLFVPDNLSRLGALVYVGWVSVTGASIYIFILLRGRALTPREVNMLPFSSLFMRMYKERESDE